MAAMNVFFFTLLLSFSSCKASLADTSSLHKRDLSISHHNPFSPKASLIRYWNKHISNSLPKPQFLFSKSSPLSAIDSAIFTKLAAENSLSLHRDSFCSLANLVCSFDPKQSSGNHGQHSNFALFSDKRFSNYGESRLSGVDSFKNYSNGLNSIADSFIRYSRDSTGHSEARSRTMTTESMCLVFDSQLIPQMESNHKLSFSSYSDETNVGAQAFTGYGKTGNRVPSEFIKYSGDSNVIESTFTGYGELGNGANDSFTVYGNSGNNPHNNFKNYGTNANSAIDSFSSYRNGANVGQDSFQSYAKNSKSGKVGFTNYGKTFNLGNDSFRDYGKGSKGKTNIGFKSYSLGRSFKVYNDKGITFAGYSNTSSFPGDSGVFASKRWVEPGKFFRESMLKQGNVMVMPDMMDKMPERSFLPLAIVSKLPFSTTSLAELKQVFQASDNSAMERVLLNTLAECERVPSRGETKRCVGSVEGHGRLCSFRLGSRCDGQDHTER
ncbi:POLYGALACTURONASE 1 BETA-LIKE PROTEIN 2 [Salix koriyanagi]|uniref:POLYGALACTURONASE 1 BETA-LIKE PROTEIN 2 n=1 Tax=Salix koriyanagi TaxID=2511006 RepID=A0A9Q0PH63_9ROSI|nr:POLYGALACTURONASE 1 BETA-LIKE PROTEIN 2 [Salix koriyanagi]